MEDEREKFEAWYGERYGIEPKYANPVHVQTSWESWQARASLPSTQPSDVVGKRKCKGCSKDISHKHPNAKFHSKECKDRYWNRVNPRGYGVYDLQDAVEFELSNEPFSNEEHDCNKE